MASSRDKMFKDVRFWVAQRVPMRQYYIDLIKEGGGEVVPLEKQADMLIADHLRKDVPRGAYSWKFIEDSVKEGIAQLKDRYAIGLDSTQARPVASGYPVRPGRTEYTREDDAILAKWVLTREEKRGGNNLYQGLEKINPRHSWQSWQNRWRKKLRQYPPAQLRILASHAPPDSDDESGQPPPPPPPPLQEPAPASAPIHQQPEARDRPSSPPPVVPSSPLAGSQDQESPPLRRNPGRRTQSSRSPAASSPGLPDLHHLAPREGYADDGATESEANSSEGPNMAEFHNDLNDYMEVANPHINLEPIIGNRQFELWQLAEAVGLQNVDVDDVDIETVNWAQVATRLGFDDFDQVLLDQLLECWEDNLRDFLKYMEEFDKTRQTAGDADHETPADVQLEDGQTIPNSGEEGDDEPDGDEVSGQSSDLFLANTGEEDDSDGDHPLPSPVVRSSNTRKRPLDSSPPAKSNSYSKRRRLAPDAVVPSTPEQLLAIPASAGSNGRSGGSKHQPSPSVVRSQRLTRLRHLNVDDTIKDSQDDTQDRLISPPHATGAQSPDLGSFDIRTPMAKRIEITANTAPSQQLRPKADSSLARSTAKHASIRAPVSELDDEPEDEASRSHQQSPSPQPAASTLHVAKKRALPSSFRNSSTPSVSLAPAQSEALRQHSTAQREPQPRSQPQPPKAPKHTKNPRDMTIAEWADHYESLGYPRANVKAALLATTMNPGTLVTTVLESLAQGDGIPGHHSGIWTERDDKDIQLLLEAGDDLDRAPVDYEEQDLLRRADRAENRLLTKHGEVWTAQRKKYISEKAAFERAKKKKREAKRIGQRRDDGSETSM